MGEWFTIAKTGLMLVLTILEMVRNGQQRGLGRLEATHEALLKAHADIAYGNAAEAEGLDAHNTNPTNDEGFDSSFKRPPE